MNKTIVLTACILMASGATAQNLIKNGKFTEHTKPTSHSQIEKATGWTSANGGSPDLFYNHTGCKRATKTMNNYQGSETAEVYAGISAFYADEAVDFKGIAMEQDLYAAKSGWQKHAEYLQGELTQPLKAGTTYRVTFQVSLSENSGRAIAGLGTYASTEMMDEKSNARMSVTPNWSEKKVISNKEGWTTISGTFTAKGGEKFITFGCFDQNFKQENVSNGGNDNQRAYYFVKGAHLKVDDGRPNYDDLLSGVSMVIPKVFFETGKADIKSVSFPELDFLAKWLNANPSKMAEVSGHTDKSGSADLNMKLSKERAAAVRQYLINKGVDGKRMTSAGYGPNRPLDTKGDQNNNPLNRRVEIRLTN